MDYTYNNVSQTTVDKLKDEIRRNDGAVVGDDNVGSFDVSGVEGRYSYYAGTLKIQILDKPFLASWSMIKEKLDAYLS